jgi:hypothetical protein
MPSGSSRAAIRKNAGPAAPSRPCQLIRTPAVKAARPAPRVTATCMIGPRSSQTWAMKATIPMKITPPTTK